jgi:nitrite reductase/ring-hydroxylating ferredoxin subunit
MDKTRDDSAWGFDRLLLTGVILLIITGLVIAAGLYVRPSETLEMPELQPVVRVALEQDFPPGASRIRSVGALTILVVRRDEDRFYALQGTSPIDGCVLRWDSESSRVFSPCRYEVYDLRGDVVTGLSTQALRRFAVSVREGVVYVSVQST